jgi:hypothetical protein
VKIAKPGSLLASGAVTFLRWTIDDERFSRRLRREEKKTLVQQHLEELLLLV